MNCWRKRGCPFNSNNSLKYQKCLQEGYSVDQCRMDNQKDFSEDEVFDLYKAETNDVVGILYGKAKKTQREIIEYLLAERVHQDHKWGEQNHSPDKWISIIGEEFGEICKAVNEYDFRPSLDTENKIIEETIQTMASCMAMIECIYRNRDC